ncbi:MAG: hypothetical protein R2699_05430 [Acidimicrobiales bacterium]
MPSARRSTASTGSLGLWDDLDADDQAAFGFDPRVIDWTRYVREIHLPSVVHHARARTTPGGRDAEPREVRLRRQVLAPERQLARSIWRTP